MTKAQKSQLIAFGFLSLIAMLTVVILLAILFYVLSRGLSMINLEFLLEHPRKIEYEVGIYHVIMVTIYLVVTTLLIATPLGVGTAILMNEYLQDGPLKKVIRFATESLSGIPSIVFGLFGFAFFVILLKPITGGWSIISGALTGVTMILPVIIRASEEALKNVPSSLREGSLALGTTRWYTIKKIVLPIAFPGILTSLILSIGRVVGETAAFILTLGGTLLLPRNIFDGSRTLALHLYMVAMETGSMDVAFGTGAVLIFLVLIINFTTGFLLKRLVKKFS